MYYFTQTLPAETLFVFAKGFASREEALQWNEETEVFENFPILSEEEIKTWEGDVVKWGPEYDRG